MRNNNYLSLINFEVKLHHHQRHFFINEHDAGGSNFYLFSYFIFYFLKEI